MATYRVITPNGNVHASDLTREKLVRGFATYPGEFDDLFEGNTDSIRVYEDGGMRGAVLVYTVKVDDPTPDNPTDEAFQVKAKELNAERRQAEARYREAFAACKAANEALLDANRRYEKLSLSYCAFLNNQTAEVK